MEIIFIILFVLIVSVGFIYKYKPDWIKLIKNKFASKKNKKSKK
tara:strand:- start:1026 stop:1157 length:132 start_codon:yes stop_codon:yes gene_type:complete